MIDVVENPIIAGPDWQPGDPLYANPDVRRRESLERQRGIDRFRYSNEWNDHYRIRETMQVPREMVQLLSDHERSIEYCEWCQVEDLIVVE